jgi:hypothetical protein
MKAVDAILPTQELAELLRREGLVPLRELSSRSYQTLWRWVNAGVRGVRLEAIKDGGRWASSYEAIDRFRARVSGQSIRTPIESPASMQRQAAAANARRHARHNKKG